MKKLSPMELRRRGVTAAELIQIGVSYEKPKRKRKRKAKKHGR